MPPSSDIDQTVSLIEKDLSLDKNVFPEPVGSAETLKEQLVPVIRYLLNNDLERLLVALYRIDIEEQRVKQVLSTEQPDQIARTLSDMIVQRELQKVLTRKKYRADQ